MKKGKINLTPEQWNSIGKACFMLGSQSQPTKKESFFATMDVAAAALSHIEDGTAFPQHRIAFPHDILIYNNASRAKTVSANFTALNASKQVSRPTVFSTWTY